MTLQEIKTADRQTLQNYLESWGGAVFAHESLEIVLAAAVENHETEGDGWGPLDKGYPEKRQ